MRNAVNEHYTKLIMGASSANRELNDVIWIRVFAIISVVAWHSYCPYLCWGIANSPFDGLYGRVFMVIAPIANMPLFTFLSGYLFCYLYKYSDKYRDFKGFFKNKVRRLLIPYLVLGFVITMTTLNDMNPVNLFYGIPNHMWYCLMLFWCFIVCWVVENKMWKWFNYPLALASLCFVIYHGAYYTTDKSPLGIYMLTYFYFFFYLGYIVFSKKELVIKIMKYAWPLVFVLYFATMRWHLGGHLLGARAILWVLLLLFVVNKIKINPPIWMKTLSKYSFGIYVFHDWIIRNVARYEPMKDIMNEHYILFPLILFILAFFIGLVLTHYLLKTKIGRFLLA